MSVLLYVDDLVIANTNLEEIGCVKSQLVASFEMKEVGDLHYFLGIEVIQTPEGILIRQRHYVLNMLFKFGMMDCKSVSTPLDRNDNLDPGSERLATRSLMYLTITWPNLNYPAGLINQLMSTGHLITFIACMGYCVM